MIAVVGLGKIGLPLAVHYASKGHDVVGVDVSKATIELVNAGREPFPGEAGLAGLLADVVNSGKLKATDDYGVALRGAQVVVVVVPLFVDDVNGQPDFRSMDSATASIASGLRRDTLVVYETTVPVGTTRRRFAPTLESLSGLVEGTDFHVAFSPERVLTGRVFADLRKYPKLVGGLSEIGAKRATAFYEEVLEFDERHDLDRPNGVWDLGSAEAAEMAKLAETTYRDVNIALANQFAIFGAAHGIDVHEVIEASNSQPYSHIHRPGIAVGGHCIPVYPRLYLWNDPEATVVRAARDANASMPRYAVSLLESTLGGLAGMTVAILGAAYRGGVKETAFSGVFPTRDALEACGADVMVHDPLYSDVELQALGLQPYRFGGPIDAAIVQTDHEMYKTVDTSLFPGLRAIVDGRRITDGTRWADVPRIVI